jgi:hypothetical protein
MAGLIEGYRKINLALAVAGLSRAPRSTSRGMQRHKEVEHTI